ncbi:MAG: tail fiber domain-containing protein [Phycisphaerae bacterium]
MNVRMSGVRYRSAMVIAMSVVFAGFATAADVGTEFTYQGRLENGGVPAEGAHDMRFRLYNAVTAGAQVGVSRVHDGNFEPVVNVVDGLFTVKLDFGALFDGTALWLEIDVRPDNVGSYTTLSPRQPLCVVPYAIYALKTAGWAVNGTAVYHDPGNVGIGTNAPSEALDVNGSIRSFGGSSAVKLDGAARQLSGNADDILRIVTNSSATNSRSWIELWGNDVSRAGELTLSGTYISFRSNSTTASTGTERMRLESGGNLGIGTLDPEVKLHLAGGADASLGGGGYLQVGASNAANLVLDDNEIMARSNGAAATLTLNNDGGNVHLIPTGIGNVGIGTNTPGAALDIRVPAGSADKPLVLGQSGGADLVTFTSSGRIGVGTTSPIVQLDMTGDARILGELTVDGGTLAVDNEDNTVGIGTTIPNAKLDLRGDMILNTVGTVTAPDATLHVYNGSAGSVAASTSSEFVLEDDSSCHATFLAPDASERGVIFGSPSDNNHGGVYYTNAAGLTVRTGGNLTRMVVNSSGQVGIGTADPMGFTLAVSGSAAKVGGGSWSILSDARLKRNIVDLAGALERLLALRGTTFEYARPDHALQARGEQIGFIAQEVERVFPDWVEVADNGYKFVTVKGFEALTVEALRELRAEKDAEIAELRGQVSELKLLVAQLLAAPAARTDGHSGTNPTAAGGR